MHITDEILGALVTWFEFIPSMDNDNIHYKVSAEITYPLLSIPIPSHTLLGWGIFMLGLQLNHASKKGTFYQYRGQGANQYISHCVWFHPILCRHILQAIITFETERRTVIELRIWISNYILHEPMGAIANPCQIRGNMGSLVGCEYSI